MAKLTKLSIEAVCDYIVEHPKQVFNKTLLDGPNANIKSVMEVFHKRIGYCVSRCKVLPFLLFVEQGKETTYYKRWDIMPLDHHRWYIYNRNTEKCYFVS